MTKDTFSADDWQSELDDAIQEQVRGRRHHLCFAPPPAQEYYLYNAREAGVDWDTIMAYCKSRGWGGSESTLLRYYRQMKGK